MKVVNKGIIGFKRIGFSTKSANFEPRSFLPQTRNTRSCLTAIFICQVLFPVFH